MTEVGNVRCPACKSEKFYLVIERQWSFYVKHIGLEDVVPGKVYPEEFGGKTLTCDDCGINIWIDEYHRLKSGMVLSLMDTMDEQALEVEDECQCEELNEELTKIDLILGVDPDDQEGVSRLELIAELVDFARKHKKGK